jgi:hypothetical protein
MASFLVETYLAKASAGEPGKTAERARQAVAELASEGTEVRYVRSYFLSDDETCFHVFEGASADAVGEAAARARIEFDRIVRVVE